MSKMGLHDPFGYLKHNLWPKERSGVKLPIRLPSTKNQELPWFTCFQVVCHILLESSRWGLQLYFRPHINWRFKKNVIGLQSRKNSHFRNFGTPKLGVLGQNDIWVQAMWLGTKNNIMVKVVDSPKCGLCEFYECMFAHGLSMHQKCSNYALTNLLFGLCKFVWIIDSLVILPSPYPGAPIGPSTPPKRCELGGIP